MLKQRSVLVHCAVIFIELVNKIRCKETMMKNTLKKAIIIIVLASVFTLAGCDKNDEISENSVLVERNDCILYEEAAC